MTGGKHTHTDRCVGIELQGVYDGVAYWRCDDGQERHRFPPDTPLARRIVTTLQASGHSGELGYGTKGNL